ncbi:MAG: pyridoxal phosphate-dependent aminotransferase [Bacteriovoracaceae bacterium]|nr:pyridoxal phosphate-dependent aminotransferase [Bacteriovoracaceae bacterium]
MKLSERVNNITESKTVGLASIVDSLRQKGEQIISLNVGEPDFKTPTSILEATKAALDEGQTLYSLVPGIRQLREALVDKLKKNNGIDVTIDNIVVSNGSKQSLYNIFQTICDPGDEVIVPIPYWVTFPESIKLAGGRPVLVETSTPDHQLDLEKIKAAITKNTKAILFNSPNNPTGAVYSKESLEQLAELCIKHDLYLIADEAYELLVYDQKKHFSVASLSKEVSKRTITVQSFSKSYCMTGFRIGYVVADQKVIKGINKLQSHLTGNNCTFAQFGALAAINADPMQYEKMRVEFEMRRDLSYELTSKIFDCAKPTGAFYLFPNVQKYLGERFKTCTELAEYILQEAKVAVVPGSAFGAPGYLRISFANSRDNLQKALTQIKEVL